MAYQQRTGNDVKSFNTEVTEESGEHRGKPNNENCASASVPSVSSAASVFKLLTDRSGATAANPG